MSLCACLVAYGILGFLKPERSTGKITRFVCALCFLISLCNALFLSESSLPSFSLPAASDIDYSAVSNEALEEAVGQMLKNNGISFEKISVSSSENGDGGIYINEIAVYGTDSPERCRELIKDNTGLTEEVRIYEQ